MKFTATPTGNRKPANPLVEPGCRLSKDGMVDIARHPTEADPAETAQEVVHQVMPKADVPTHAVGPQDLSTDHPHDRP